MLTQSMAGALLKDQIVKENDCIESVLTCLQFILEEESFPSVLYKFEVVVSICYLVSLVVL